MVLEAITARGVKDVAADFRRDTNTHSGSGKMGAANARRSLSAIQDAL
jgi:hypothetical protein